eukprot:1897123-Rhodomonas_salina.5
MVENVTRAKLAYTFGAKNNEVTQTTRQCSWRECVEGQTRENAGVEHPQMTRGGPVWSHQLA